MDITDFKAAVADTAKLLRALAMKLPKYVDARLVAYLEQLEIDQCGLEMLFNSLEWESTQKQDE